MKFDKVVFHEFISKQLTDIEQQKLVIDNQNEAERLAKIVAKKYSLYSEIDDLIGQAMVYLVRAAKTYDPDKNPLFIYYYRRLAQLDLEREAHKLLRHSQVQGRSLDDPVGNKNSQDDVTSVLRDYLEDLTYNDAEITDAKGAIEHILKDLDERARYVLVHKFGLGDLPRMTNKEIAANLNISERGVISVYNRAVAQIKKNKNTYGLSTTIFNLSDYTIPSKALPEPMQSILMSASDALPSREMVTEFNKNKKFDKHLLATAVNNISMMARNLADGPYTSSLKKEGYDVSYNPAKDITAYLVSTGTYRVYSSTYQGPINTFLASKTFKDEVASVTASLSAMAMVYLSSLSAMAMHLASEYPEDPGIAHTFSKLMGLGEYSYRALASALTDEFTFLETKVPRTAPVRILQSAISLFSSLVSARHSFVAAEDCLPLRKLVCLMTEQSGLDLQTATFFRSFVSSSHSFPSDTVFKSMMFMINNNRDVYSPITVEASRFLFTNRSSIIPKETSKTVTSSDIRKFVASWQTKLQFEHSAGAEEVSNILKFYEKDRFVASTTHSSSTNMLNQLSRLNLLSTPWYSTMMDELYTLLGV